VGEYVYLPYAHAGMCEAVTIKGDFLKREDWTLKAALTLIDFRPRAIFTGDVISSYQREQVPRLIAHIRECDPDMWAQLIAARPELDVAPNYVGRTALLRTLAHPITIPAKNASYPVSWLWDGETLTTADKDAYWTSFGGVKAESLVLKIVPAKDATVTVADNAWVTSETVFVD
jgi:hypothetical protein